MNSLNNVWWTEKFIQTIILLVVSMNFDTMTSDSEHITALCLNSHFHLKIKMKSSKSVSHNL
jgi:hypothetical protein